MKWSMEKIFDRPPMKNRQVNVKLYKDLRTSWVIRVDLERSSLGLCSTLNTIEILMTGIKHGNN